MTAIGIIADIDHSPLDVRYRGISGPSSGAPHANMPAGAPEVRFYPSSPFGEPKAPKPHLVAQTRENIGKPVLYLGSIRGYRRGRLASAPRNFIDSCQNSLRQTAVTVRLGFGHHPRNEAAFCGFSALNEQFTTAFRLTGIKRCFAYSEESSRGGQIELYKGRVDAAA